MANQENTNPGKGQNAKDRQPPRQGQDNDQSGNDSGSGSKDKSGNRGNFANNPDRAREAGQKGGQSR
jgi:general stress protein YciG